MIEKALVHEIETRIQELKDQVYPTNAPEHADKPYMVYYNERSTYPKTLNGHTGNKNKTYIFSVMAVRYSDMKSLTEKVEDFLISLPMTYIGKNNDYYVMDIDINDSGETYEDALKVNRGIIIFTIYY